MKTKPFKLIVLAVLSSFVLTAVFPAGALAGPPPGGRPGHHGGPHYPGPAFKHVPPGGRPIWFGDINYVFYRGYCYRPTPDGYIYARPPVGLVVYSLPAAAVTMMVAGLTYYLYDNVYYRRVPAGYQVVTAPVGVVTTVQTPVPVTSTAVVPANTIPSGTQAVVTINSLNVRSGPGLNHAVLCQVFKGNILFIQGSAPDWYYVLLPDRTFGWVMEQFVSVSGNTGPQG